MAELSLRGFSAAAFRALASAAWPELLYFCVIVDREGSDNWDVDSEEGEALGAAAFARCPKLEELLLGSVPVGAAGARVLASQRWPKLWLLQLVDAQLDNAALAALARGAWPALVHLNLWRNAGIRAPPTLADAQR